MIEAFRTKFSEKTIVRGGDRRRIKHSDTEESNKFTALAEGDGDEDVDIMRHQREGVFADTCRKVLRYVRGDNEIVVNQ